MVKMVAFDLDGTLCDSIPMCIEAICQAVSPYADHEITEKDVIETFGLNEIGMIKAVVNQNWEQALQDFYQYYDKLHHMCPEPFPGICELIDFLKEKHIIVALITGKGEKSCDITLKKLGLNNTFVEIVTGSEKSPNKAEAILYLMQKYAVKADEFYYVGDAVSDAVACHKAGVTCLSTAWAKLSNSSKLREINPSYVFETITELKTFFIR